MSFIYLSLLIADAFIPAFVELTTTNVSENMSKLKTAGVDFPIGNHIFLKI